MFRLVGYQCHLRFVALGARPRLVTKLPVSRMALWTTFIVYASGINPEIMSGWCRWPILCPLICMQLRVQRSPESRFWKVARVNNKHDEATKVFAGLTMRTKRVMYAKRSYQHCLLALRASQPLQTSRWMGQRVHKRPYFAANSSKRSSANVQFRGFRWQRIAWIG